MSDTTMPNIDLRDKKAKQTACAEQTGSGGHVRPVPFRGGGFVYRPVRFVGPLVFLVLLGVWEAGTRSGLISPLVLPTPAESWQALVNLATSGMLWKHVAASSERLFIGWTVGTILGIAAGLMIGLFSVARSGFQPLVSALFPIPKIALLPLFVIWFGIDEGSKNATIIFGTFFPTVISTYSGVDNVDRTLIRMGQSFGLSWLSIVRKIVIPGAMPAILSGFRISSSIAIVLLVAAEMIGAEFGVGAYVLMAGSLMATDQLIAGVAILSVMGLIIAWVIGLAEKYFLRWRT